MTAGPRLDTAAVKERTDLLALIEPATDLRKVAAREYAGPCPRCGGKDRFRLHLDKGWFCRHCTGEPGASAHWMDALDFVMWHDGVNFVEAYERLGGGGSLSPDEVARLKAEQAERDRERQERERSEREERQAELDASGAAAAYHRNMTADHRALWHDRGLSDLWIDYFQVGVCERRTFWHDGKSFDSPTLTIPTWRPSLHYNEEPSVTWRCVNLVHRLLIPNPPGGKYRPHLAGTGKALFNCDLYSPQITGEVLLVEGEIKAMVTWAHLQEDVNRRHPADAMGRLTVVGIAGKSFKREWVEEFGQAGRIYICLDPDAQHAADSVAHLLGAHRCKILDLPDKIDDMLNAGTLHVEKLGELLNTARGVR
jgi:hypothetical protein